MASARTHSHDTATDGEAAAAMRRDGRGTTVMRKANEACKRMPNFQAAVVLIHNGRSAWLYESQPNLLASMGFTAQDIVIEERRGPDHFESVAERNQGLRHQVPAIETVPEPSLFVSPPPTTPPGSPTTNHPLRSAPMTRRGRRRAANPGAPRRTTRNAVDNSAQVENIATGKKDIYGFTDMDEVE